LRFGELAGLEWKQVALDKGVIAVERQFTHGAWSNLKTANSRRRIPLARELLRQLKLHRLQTPGELVFPGPSTQPIDYHNWRNRVWAPLLKKAGVTGTFHMLRHFFVTALIQGGANAKVAQTLTGHTALREAKLRRCPLIVSRLDRLSRNVHFISLTPAVLTALLFDHARDSVVAPLAICITPGAWTRGNPACRSHHANLLGSRTLPAGAGAKCMAQMGCRCCRPGASRWPCCT
jgi:hypothetical protein